MGFRALCALLAVCISMTSYGDDVAEKGRAILEKNKDAVITVFATMGLAYGGNEQEQESWANGVVIGEDGLAVLSLTAVDPSVYVRAVREGAEISAKVKSLKMLTRDGREIPAEVVLRDTELDLVFIRPLQKPEQPMAHVDVADAGRPQLLDQLAIITQLGQVAGRAHSVLIERIETVMDRPRTMYVLGGHRAQDVLCSAAFTLEGQFVGVGVLRAIHTADQKGPQDNTLVVIVPASDIQEGLTQVPPPAAP